MHSCSISTFDTFHFLNVYFRIFLHPDGSHENGPKGVHCVDLGESFPTNIYLQDLASIQPITSRLKLEGIRCLRIVTGIMFAIAQLRSPAAGHRGLAKQRRDLAPLASTLAGSVAAWKLVLGAAWRGYRIYLQKPEGTGGLLQTLWEGCIEADFNDFSSFNQTERLGKTSILSWY